MGSRIFRTATLAAGVFLLSGILVLAGAEPNPSRGLLSTDSPAVEETTMVKKIQKTEAEWKEILTAEQYRVLRKAGTERPYTGKYNDLFESGTYVCGACGTPLFASTTKYDHASGWPSFTAPIAPDRLEYGEDRSHGMVRTEVRCAACGSHLGHVFDDGPKPTGQHFCINSISLEFKPGAPAKEANEEVTEKALFAAGCFWGVEDKFGKIKGVISTRVGYTGGQTKDPTYEQVCSDATGHAETVEVVFDPKQVSYTELLEAFFSFHDPTQINRQGPDTGTQYRSAIFYLNSAQKEAALAAIAKLDASAKYDCPVATQVLPASDFYQAEEYHQKFYEKLGRRK